MPAAIHRSSIQHRDVRLSGGSDRPILQGQMVTMTYPQIGNTGINPEDIESRAIVPVGSPSGTWSATPTGALPWCLLSQGERRGRDPGVDTRALTRHLRDKAQRDHLHH